MKPVVGKLGCEPHAPEQIAAERELAAEEQRQEPDPASTKLQATDQALVDSEWIARKAFTGSAAVAHAAQSSTATSKEERQRSLFHS